MFTLRGRVSMKSTASATSEGSISAPLALARSRFSLGQSLSSAEIDRAGGDLADADAVLVELAPHGVDEEPDRVLEAV